MSKTTATYWNVLAPENSDRWKTVAGSAGMIQQITLAIDPMTGDYTRITRFQAGTNTTAFGAKVHNYPEEIFVISGRLYDEAFKIWLEPGYYASRPPGEVHGPFHAATECLIWECSYPSQAISD